MPHIEHLSISGFKSIRKLEKFGLRPLNVLIGANGAGKSNLLYLFKMISALSQKRLQLFVESEGGADALLFGGRKLTSRLEVVLSFKNNRCEYAFSLEPTVDSVAFSGEKLTPGVNGISDPTDLHCGGLRTVCGVSEWPGGHSESQVANINHGEFATYVLPDMERWRVFHFQDMGLAANVRNQSEVRDNLQLKPDAGNLGPFLRYLREHHPNHYQRIRDVVRLANPFFKDFVYRANQNPGDNMELECSEALVGADTVFGPKQLSGGMLRFICLATLLNQPENLQPNLILIDEPELGLHPFALTILAEMINQVADLKQVIISTQSAELVSHFEPEDIVVIDRKNEESVFKRLDSAPLTDWFENYTLGDLWKMNVFGGRP